MVRLRIGWRGASLALTGLGRTGPRWFLLTAVRVPGSLRPLVARTSGRCGLGRDGQPSQYFVTTTVRLPPPGRPSYLGSTRVIRGNARCNSLAWSSKPGA
jgi:hypothetical protein